MLLRKSLIHPLFRNWQIACNVWRIEEKYFDSWNLANIYYVKGSQTDLLVDTGVGVHDLSSYLLWSGIRENCEKPLMVALTHTHFDHSGGAHQFANLPAIKGIYVHEKELGVMGSKYYTAAWITSEEVIPKPSGQWKAKWKSSFFKRHCLFFALPPSNSKFGYFWH